MNGKTATLIRRYSSVLERRPRPLKRDWLLASPRERAQIRALLKIALRPSAAFSVDDGGAR